MPRCVVIDVRQRPAACCLQQDSMTKSHSGAAFITLALSLLHGLPWSDPRQRPCHSAVCLSGQSLMAFLFEAFHKVSAVLRWTLAVQDEFTFGVSVFGIWMVVFQGLGCEGFFGGGGEDERSNETEFSSHLLPHEVDIPPSQFLHHP
jgi:hypothetical protein